jgi:hypothetical protein
MGPQIEERSFRRCAPQDDGQRRLGESVILRRSRTRFDWMTVRTNGGRVRYSPLRIGRTIGTDAGVLRRQIIRYGSRVIWDWVSTWPT